jgi:hypothetical protein
MRAILKRILINGLMCCAFSALAYFVINVYAFWLSLPMFAFALGPALMELLVEMRHPAAELMGGAEQGHVMRFGSRRMRVLEDDDHAHWVAADDIRAVLGGGLRDAALQRAYPGLWRPWGRPPCGYLREDAVQQWLAKASSLEGVRLRTWVQRNVVFPAQRRRERLGVQLAPLGDVADSTV